MTALSKGSANAPSAPGLRDELKAALDMTLPQTPGEFAERLIKEKWGADIDPQTALLVTLDYHFKGHPAQDGVEQGRVASSRSLLQDAAVQLSDCG